MMQGQDGENEEDSRWESEKVSGNGVIMDEETVPESWEERSEEDDDVIMSNEKNNQEPEEGTEKYWEQVKQGGNGKIVKIKEENTTRNENQYSVLTNETEDMEVEVIGTKTMDELAAEEVLKGEKKNIKTINISSISKMTVKDIAETVYANESIKNRDITRNEVYDREEQKLRVQLIQIVDKHKTEAFLEETKDLARKFKDMDATYLRENSKEVYENVKRIQELSDIDVTDPENMDLTRKAFWNIKTNIKAIEQYAEDPMLSVPANTLQIGKCTAEQISKANYFQLLMGVMYAKGEIGNLLSVNMRFLRVKAYAVQKISKVTNEEKMESPSKKMRTSDTIKEKIFVRKSRKKQM